MALPILDGNQTAATLSTVLTSGEHIPAHTVVSLGSQAITDVRSAVSGSVVSISNFPASQSTTFGAVTGSVSVLNFPSTQTIAGTVTANLSTTDYSEIENIRIGTDSIDAKLTSVAVGSLPAISGTVTARTDLDAYGNSCVVVAFESPAGIQRVANVNGFPIRAMQDQFGTSIPLPISGTVTIGNSVTIGSLPAISGTVTANAGGDFAGAIEIVNDVSNVSHKVAVQLYDDNGSAVGVSNNPLPISGTVTANVTNSVTVGAIIGPAGGSCLQGISGSGDAVRIVLQGRDSAGNYSPIVGSGLNQYNIPIYGTVTVGNSVTIGSLPAISGTVTANNPAGALTTRFGSVTTANTAQITSAVTNTSRKYLLAQNISAGTVTIGIGFSPTTTQGIQLSAGGGLTFDAFCPTGAVYWLGAVTGAAFTILEG